MSTIQEKVKNLLTLSCISHFEVWGDGLDVWVSVKNTDSVPAVLSFLGLLTEVVGVRKNGPSTELCATFKNA